MAPIVVVLSDDIRGGTVKKETGSDAGHMVIHVRRCHWFVTIEFGGLNLLLPFFF